MIYANPAFFWLLILIPIYIFFEIAQKTKTAIQISVYNDLKKAQGFTILNLLPWLEHLLIVTIIALFSITLARPQGSYEKQTSSKKGIDTIIALDVSQSMLAQDLKPNRISAAKESIIKYIDNIQSDRLGIIVFSGQAFTQSPLTFDYSILQTYLEQISTDSINQNIRGLSGTAIGDAILSATSRLKQSEDRTKVLILLTDGEANTGVDPILASQKAKEEGIKIYTIGIGQEGGAPIPVTNLLGQKTYAQNQDGSIYKAKFNEQSLKDIASIGEGKYFRVGNNQQFKNVLTEIQSLEKTDIEVETTTEYTEKFIPYLIALIISFFTYIIIKSIKPILF